MDPRASEPRSVPPSDPAHRAVHDARWAGEARTAAGCAGLLLVLSLTVDAGGDGLTLPSTLRWIALSVALFVVLLPARVSAAPGLITVRTLWARRTVRTDRLVALRWPTGIEQCVDLVDMAGGRARVELRVLLANPSLWLLLEADARFSAANSTLPTGSDDLDRLARRIEGDTARSVFTVSGLR
ncbi:hypothetical protein R6L23_00105 [Streptomyces sp. SR27]|uniref:hypothetical protein n=1 Tax=Streptomyces sp. SR27 TaxID=3076630 RepID=UPI00295C1D18|nr:hypothetical protein [Streptomyces sp. SR27]MDV9186662.1 hypothetical protein [Streptomyces sp. SR27]